jgi:hypothetical protein
MALINFVFKIIHRITLKEPDDAGVNIKYLFSISEMRP